MEYEEYDIDIEEANDKVKCPECNGYLNLISAEDYSDNGMQQHYKYYCNNCEGDEDLYKSARKDTEKYFQKVLKWKEDNKNK